MADEGRAPHGILLAAVVAVVVGAPIFLGGGEAITGFISDMLSPAVLLLLPVGLVLVIRFLSSDGANAFVDVFSFGGPDSIHRVGGSPVGVALVLVILLLLLYYKVSLFGGDDDGDD